MTTRRQCLLHLYDEITFTHQLVHLPNGIESFEPLNWLERSNTPTFIAIIQFIESKVNEGQIARRIERTPFDIQLSWVDSALQMADPMLLLPLTAHKHNMCTRARVCVWAKQYTNVERNSKRRNTLVLYCTYLSLYIYRQSSYIEISHSVSSRAKTYREPESKSAVERQILLTLGVLVIE